MNYPYDIEMSEKKDGYVEVPITSPMMNPEQHIFRITHDLERKYLTLKFTGKWSIEDKKFMFYFQKQNPTN